MIHLVIGNHTFLGHIERRFIEVPLGATWVEATMQASGFDTVRKFFIDAVQVHAVITVDFLQNFFIFNLPFPCYAQLCPLKRPLKWESVATFASPSTKNFSFPVVGGQTMELAIAQFWSSGMGSHETTIVDFEVFFSHF